MANKELTEVRVRNVMRNIPKSAMIKREGKTRTTLKETLSSMRAILGKLSKNKSNKQKEAQSRKKLVTTAIITVVVLVIVLVIILIAIF